MFSFGRWSALALVCMAAPSLAQEAPGPRAIPAGAVVRIAVAQSVSSKTAKRGDTFAIRLAQPLVVNGTILADAGVTGMGEVVHAAPARGGGKQGELILAARYLEIDGVRVPLRAFRLTAAGEDKGGDAIVAAAILGAAAGPAGIFAFAIEGGQIEVPEGASASAVIAAETILKPADTSGAIHP